MSASGDRVKDLLEHLSDALALEATVVIEEDGPATSAPRSRARTWGCSSVATARRSTPSSTWPSKPRRATNRRPPGLRVVVDAAGYRERREQALQRQADEAAENALDSGRPVALDAMSATERKVVHEYLKDRDDVETYSQGTEPDRHLVVAPLTDA